MAEYPKWKYHRTLEPVVVDDPDAEAALGPGWFDSPVDARKMDDELAPQPSARRKRVIRNDGT